MTTFHPASLSETQADISTLNRLLNELADYHELCSDYDDAIETINSSLTSFKLEGRARPWAVTIELQMDVKARDEDEAEAEAMRLIRQHGWNNYQTRIYCEEA